MYIAIEKDKFNELMNYAIKNTKKVDINYDIINIYGDWFIYFANVIEGLYYVANRYRIRKIKVDKLRKFVIIEKGKHPSMSQFSIIKNQAPITKSIWNYENNNEQLVKMILFDLLLFRPETTWDRMSYYIEGDTITFV